MEFHKCDFESEFRSLFNEFNSGDPLLNRNIIVKNGY